MSTERLGGRIVKVKWGDATVRLEVHAEPLTLVAVESAIWAQWPQVRARGRGGGGLRGRQNALDDKRRSVHGPTRDSIWCIQIARAM